MTSSKSELVKLELVVCLLFLSCGVVVVGRLPVTNLLLVQ